MKIQKQHLIPLSLSIFFFFIYIVTLPPEIFWQDSGIYATGIAVEGNVYPPGYPVYMVLGLIWRSLLPIGTLGQEIGALSVVFTAISSVFVYHVVKILIGNKDTLYKKKRAENKEIILENSMPAKSGSQYPREWRTPILAAVGTAIFLLNYNVWAQATNVEVYAFHTLFLSIIIYLIVKIGQWGRIEKNNNSIINKLIYILALIYGLSYGNHPMTVVLIPTFIILAIMQSNIFAHLKTLIIALIIFVLSGLIPYLYLPLIANTQPSLNWGNPNSIERFVNQVTGKTYLTGEQSIVFNDLSRYQAAAQEFIWEYHYIGIAIALFGAVIIFKRNKTIAAVLFSIILFHIFFAIFYKQTTEYNSWLIPAHLAVTLLITLAFDQLLSYAQNANAQKKYMQTAAAIIPLLLFAAFFIPHSIATATELDRRNYYYPIDFGENLLRNLDQNSIFFMTGDQESSTTMYIQSVLKFRKDVNIIKNIDQDNMLYPEGRELLRKQFPSVIFPEQQVDSSTIDQYYNKLVEANSGQHSIYMMSKNIFPLNDSYILIPAAAFWQVSTTVRAPDLKYWNFEYHDPQFYLKKERPLMSLKDASKPGGINRVPFIQHMINFELQSWKVLSDWYIQTGECDKAKQAIDRMRTVSPSIDQQLPQLQQNLNSCYDH